MRKIIFTIVGSMLISLGAVQAQQSDTTGTASKSKSKQNKYKTEQSRKDRNKANQDQSWQQRSDRMGAQGDQTVVVIDVQEIPADIRQKLEADQKYSGWEKATVYHNTNTGDYVFIPQPFRLDKQGNEQEMTGDQAWGYNNRYNDQSSQRARQNDDMSGQNEGMQGRSQERAGQDQEQSQQNQDMSSQEQTQSQSDMNRSGDNQSTQGRVYSDESSDQQQSDSYRTQQDQSGDQQQQQSQSNDQQQNSQSYRTEDNQYSTADMVEVKDDQIPESLRTTLQESEYEGWQQEGKLYRNPSTSEYVLIIDKSDNASQERRYRFDANGERVNE